MTLRAVESKQTIIRLPENVYAGLYRRIGQTSMLEDVLHTTATGEEGLMLGDVLYMKDEPLEISNTGECDRSAKPPRIQNRAYIDVNAALHDALNSIEDGSITPDKVIIICLDNSSEESYTINWFQGGMRYTDVVLLLTITQHKFMAMLEQSCGHRHNQQAHIPPA